MMNQPTDYQQVIAQCRAGGTFRPRLPDDPVETLKAEGLEVSAGVQIR
jgi:hypothetical protein